MGKPRGDLTKYRWKKGQSGNPKGRPPRLFKQLAYDLKQRGYEKLTPSQLQEAIEMLLVLPQSEMKKILEDDKEPMLYKVIIRSVLSQKGVDVLEKLLDRIYGKPKQTNTFGVEENKNVRFVLEVQGDDQDTNREIDNR